MEWSIAGMVECCLGATLYKDGGVREIWDWDIDLGRCCLFVHA